MRKSIIFLYFLSFLEGAAVMAAELLGAKMMAPYFGTSLYVWSSVLGVTLGGLALGYFVGGFFSGRDHRERTLHIVLLASAVFLVMMPVLAKEVMLHTTGFGIVSAILISSVIFLFPPVFFMGMVSPLIVGCIAAEGGKAGRTAGTVYAISTVGGILSTFLMGFYIIPAYGLAKPAIIAGAILGILPFVRLIRGKVFFALLFPLAAFFALSSLGKPVEKPDIRILYTSEGLLGQIIVADYPVYEGVRKTAGSQRILFVNRSTQTIVTTKNGEKGFFEYVHLIAGMTKVSAGEKRSALVLGLGGGSAANVLVRNGFQVTAAELDPRMADVAKNYFELSEKVTVHVDDARHFLKTQRVGAKETPAHDVILLDAFIGEVNPHHLFTAEFFAEVRSVLSDSGTFFINGNGYWNGSAGRGMRAVCKTLLSSGFDVEVVPTQEEEDYRNLVFIAKKSRTEKGSLSSAKIQDLDLDAAVILTDDKPQLEILNAEANKKWREACMKYFLSGYYSGQDRLLFE